MTVLVTGAAGFIGAELCRRLAARGDAVVTGIDNLSDYYDVGLKKARLARLDDLPRFAFEKLDLSDRNSTLAFFRRARPRRVVHLAAQAGVRHSLRDPWSYADANLVGFLNVLEGCRHGAVEHLVFASTSAVYGANRKLPFSVHDGADHPLSLYAASKKANELMAHCYSHLYALPATGLRFFTVYGPWGRPDMALFRFTRSILAGEPIDVYNHGRHRRDFTYIDDIVEGVARRSPIPPPPTRTGTRRPPTRRRATPPGACSTSATTPRWSSTATSRPSRAASGGRRSATSCPFSRGTSPRPRPTSKTSPPSPATVPARPSRKGCRVS